MATILIKRYRNRKLYDTREAQYVNFSDIREMIKNGDAVRIVDHYSKEDLTRGMLHRVWQQGVSLPTVNALESAIRQDTAVLA